MKRPFSFRHLSPAHAVVALSFCTVAAGFFGAVAYGVFSERTQALEAESALQTKLAEQDALRNAVGLANQTENERAALAELAVPKNGGAALIAQIENLGQTAHVTLKIQSVTGAGPKGDTPGELVLSIQVSGTFANIMRLERLIETLPFGTSVSTIWFQYDSTGKVWNATLSAMVVSYDTPV